MQTKTANLGFDVKPHQPDLLFTFFNELNIISQLSSNMFERAMPDGLNTSQFTVLNWFVRVDSEATPARLATAFQVTRGAMTNTLKKLESKGLVNVRTNEASGRSKLVTMTPKGKEVRDAAIAAAAPMLSDFAKQYDANQISHLLPQLIEIRQYLDEYRFRDQT